MNKSKMPSKLLRPERLFLFIFGCIVACPTAFYIYTASFACFFDSDFYYVLGGIALLIFCGACLLIDRLYTSRLIRYGIVVSMVYILLLGIYIPVIKPWLIKNSEDRGTVLLHAIQSYYNQQRSFPSSLEDSFFSNVQMHTIDLRPFRYRVYNGSDNEIYAEISVGSFRGKTAVLSTLHQKWSYHD
ncbi:MAG: hypothetical protein ACKVOK_03990 [Flavobacteriales bacterium]